MISFSQRDARKRQLAESDEEDEESQQELMKKHAEEKIALLTDDSNEDFEDELEAVSLYYCLTLGAFH